MVAITTDITIDRPLRLVTASPPAPTPGRLLRPVAVVFAVAALALALGYLALNPPAEAPATVADSGATYEVQPGDNMWSIAVDLAPGSAADHYVEDLVELNGGATVTAGQVLRLPG